MNLPDFINMEFFVAGLGHHQYEEAKDQLPEGTSLTLVPQPDNPFDSTAMQIRFKDYMLGFIPARTGEAKLIFQALAAGRTFTAVVTRNKPETVVHRRLQVQVKET